VMGPRAHIATPIGWKPVFRGALKITHMGWIECSAVHTAVRRARFRHPASLLLALAATAALLVTGAPPASAQDGGAAGAAPATQPKTTLPDVEDEVMCPVCGTLLSLAAEAPQANDQRKQIRAWIAEGLTKEEIKDRLVAE